MITVFEKDAVSTQRPASTLKLLNALVLRDWLLPEELPNMVSVTSADTVDWSNNSNAGLIDGDSISYEDLLYGMLLPSGNDAGKCIARHVGALIISGAGPGSSLDPVTRFVEAMNAKAAVIGMHTAVITDSFGLDSGNTASAKDLAFLMIEFIKDAYLVEVSGTLTRGLTISGPNARTENVTHTIDPGGSVLIPEFICGKTGTTWYTDSALDSGGCLAVLWEAPSGARRVTTILGADENPARYQDLRKLIDYELARMGEL